MDSLTLNTGPEQYNWTLPNNEEGMTEKEIARPPQIPRSLMPTKQDGPVMLVSAIPMGRPIPQKEQPPVYPHQPRKTLRQEVSPTVTVVQQHKHPRQTQDSTRKVTRGPLDASPITRSHPLFANLESLVSSLKGNHGQFKERLDEHD